MGVQHLEGHITDPRNKRLEETSRRQRRREASSEEYQGPEGAVAPWMEWTGIINLRFLIMIFNNFGSQACFCDITIELKTRMGRYAPLLSMNIPKCDTALNLCYVKNESKSVDLIRSKFYLSQQFFLPCVIFQKIYKSVLQC